jgi:hypothetical protein
MYELWSLLLEQCGSQPPPTSTTAVAGSGGGQEPPAGPQAPSPPLTSPTVPTSRQELPGGQKVDKSLKVGDDTKKVGEGSFAYIYAATIKGEETKIAFKEPKLLDPTSSNILRQVRKPAWCKLT